MDQAAAIDAKSLRSYSGMMVLSGLGTPPSRAFVAGSLAASISYIAKWPSFAFTKDGNIKPIGVPGIGPTSAGNEFLMLPVGVAAFAYLFT